MTTAALTLLSVPGVLGLTNLIKGLGVRGRWSALVAVTVAIVLVLGQYALRRVDGGALWLQLEQAVIIALSAMGLWDLASPDSGYTPARAQSDVE